MSALATLYRREHYADLAGPPDWSGHTIARWLVGLCLRRDGRSDALVAAETLVPQLREASLRERAALSLAMWEAYQGPLDWPADIIAVCFSKPIEDVQASIAFVAAELRGGIGQDCRQGMADVRAVVRQAIAARGDY